MTTVTKLKEARALTEAFQAGLRVGLTRYAWWSEGRQYVGTWGTTLGDALKETGLHSWEYHMVSAELYRAIAAEEAKEKA